MSRYYKVKDVEIALIFSGLCDGKTCKEVKEVLNSIDVVSITDIDFTPSIDIIKCKECIYYEPLGYDAPKDGWCNSPKLYCDGYWVDEDDFCSDAKRED